MFFLLNVRGVRKCGRSAEEPLSFSRYLVEADLVEAGLVDPGLVEAHRLNNSALPHGVAS